MAAAKRTETSRGALALAVASVALVGVASWAIVKGRSQLGGAAAAAAGATLVISAVLVRRSGRLLDRVVGSLGDRAFDAGVFGSLAWAFRWEDAATSAAALVAVAAGSVSAYIRARGQSLGYQLEESPGYRTLRYGLVSVGLLAGLATAGVIAAAGLAIVTALLRASQVAKEERA